MVPKLRFKEFCGEWEEKKIKDFSKCYAGATPSTKINEYWENGNIPWMNSGEVNKARIKSTENFITELGFKKSSTKIVPPKTVIMALAGQGKTRGMVAITEIELCTNQSLAAIVTNDCVDDEYLYQYLKKEYTNLRLVSSGDGSRGGLNLKLINDYKIKLPELPEQTKIADFLSTVDDKIQNQQDKITHLENIKKGFMQKIFSRKIRFKDDGGDEFPEWEEKKLDDIAKRVMRKNNLNETNLSLTISAQYGLVNQETYFNRKVSSNDLSGYYVLNKGEFAYNKSYSMGYPFGAIKRLNKYEKGAVSTLYICFSLYENVDSNFIEQYFESDKWNREIYMIAVEGARNHGLLNVSIEDFFKTKHLLPCLKEQQKIADFLSSFDEKISTEKEILQHLKQLKKGLLQQMFV